MAVSSRGPARDDRPSGPAPTLGRQLLRWGLLALPVVVVLYAGWTHRLMSDDGFINLRVVDQLTSGHGPVFTQGQRVEAFTSPLWIFLLAALDLLTPIRLEWLAVLGGIGLTGAGLAFAAAGAIRLLTPADTDRRDLLYIPAGAAALAAFPPIWVWASSGLENGLSVAWIGGSTWVLGRWATTGRRLPAAAVIIGLGPLVRPELGLLTLAFLVVIVVGSPGLAWRSRAATVGWALALPLAYQIFRMGYYGMVVPNTALAKSASGARWSLGWDYVRDSVGPYALWAPVALLVAVAGVALARQAATQHDLPVRRRLLVTGALVLGGC